MTREWWSWSPLVLNLRMHGAISPFLITWCLIKHRDNFVVYLSLSGATALYVPWPSNFLQGCHPRFPNNLCFYKDGVVSLVSQPPTWWTVYFFFVWPVAFDPSGMGVPTGNI
jgi:hypothetical protein